MQFQFPMNSSTEMSFKVGIAGTQTLPSTVSVVLERDGRSLSYSAVKTGENWVAIIDNPGSSFALGDVRLSINVLLNTRLFTPFKSIASIIEEMVQAAPEAPVEVPPATEPVELPPAVELAVEIPAAPAAMAPPLSPPVDEPVAEAAPVEVAPVEVEPRVEKIKAEPAKPLPKAPIREEIVKDIVKDVLSAVVGSQTIKMGMLKSIEPMQEERVETTVIAPEVVAADPRATFKLKKVRTFYR